MLRRACARRIIVCLLTESSLASTRGTDEATLTGARSTPCSTHSAEDDAPAAAPDDAKNNKQRIADVACVAAVGTARARR